MVEHRHRRFAHRAQADQQRWAFVRRGGEGNDHHRAAMDVKDIAGEDDARSRFLDLGALRRIEADPPNLAALRASGHGSTARSRHPVRRRTRARSPRPQRSR
uniref:Uncharacterized protein n=1 Tax=mine drainage metagenome TaxID=410659 RepID=E6PD98_9ZZZZ